MDTAVFQFPAIDRLHREKTDHIHAVLKAALQPGARSDAAAYALAHHALAGAEHAARQRDLAAFTWYGQHPDVAGDRLTSTPDGPFVLTPKALRDDPTETGTPLYLIDQATTPAHTQHRDLITAAFEQAEAGGFAGLLARHAVVVCLLDHKPLNGTLRSWTSTSLPGTVHTDHTGHAAILARDLVHEAAHNWLNDALTATDVRLDPATTFYSPWKNTHRPAHGFIHACWAFSLITLYVARVLPTLSGDTEAHLTSYLDRQRTQLRIAGKDHGEALAAITSGDLRDRLHAVLTQALTV
ncbi:aKG-HExxH-type peptide beta-hydroxylase [Streptomyces sp. NPDC101455]|uniref:aKG-HExxH-type peptide beta-hydroxylase n=1 Tax=Streptomyces sp. NPDC101455 TaxID=3366142 RepID=UPI00380F3846